MSPTSRILFAGGCMVTGYPVGADISLARIALRSLGHRASEAPRVLPYVNLHSGPRIVEACREQETEFLILQLGHYETLRPFRKILFGGNKAKHNSSVSTSVPFVPDPKMLYRPTLHHRFMNARRFALAHALAAAGQKKRAFDAAAAAAALDGILLSLAPMPLRAVLLLSPFSCPDMVARAYRRELLPVFTAAAAKHKCLYVDVFGMLEDCRHHDSFVANFADQFHLSRLGHQRVGMLVGQSLRRVVREANPAYLPTMAVWPPLPSLHLPPEAEAIAS